MTHPSAAFRRCLTLEPLTALAVTTGGVAAAAAAAAAVAAAAVATGEAVGDFCLMEATTFRQMWQTMSWIDIHYKLFFVFLSLEWLIC